MMSPRRSCSSRLANVVVTGGVSHAYDVNGCVGFEKALSGLSVGTSLRGRRVSREESPRANQARLAAVGREEGGVCPPSSSPARVAGVVPWSVAVVRGGDLADRRSPSRLDASRAPPVVVVLAVLSSASSSKGAPPPPTRRRVDVDQGVGHLLDGVVGGLRDRAVHWRALPCLLDRRPRRVHLGRRGSFGIPYDDGDLLTRPPFFSTRTIHTDELER